PCVLHFFPTRRSSDLRYNFCVGLRSEVITGRLQAAANFGKVFDNTVMDHEDSLVIISLRVGVSDSRRAMRSPAGVADSQVGAQVDRKSTRLNSSHQII